MRFGNCVEGRNPANLLGGIAKGRFKIQVPLLESAAITDDAGNLGQVFDEVFRKLVGLGLCLVERSKVQNRNNRGTGQDGSSMRLPSRGGWKDNLPEQLKRCSEEYRNCRPAECTKKEMLLGHKFTRRAGRGACDYRSPCIWATSPKFQLSCWLDLPGDRKRVGW